jgi:hypothetical protein
MAEIPARYLVHTVAVQPYTGDTAYGPTHATTRDHRAFVDEERKLVRSSYGSEVVSEAALYLRRAAAPDFPLNTLVTLPSGRVATVLAVSDRSDGGQGSWQHLQVDLT